MMRENLYKWEEYLIPYFQMIRLLSEIPFSRLDCEEIGQLLRFHIECKNLSTATSDFEVLFPRTFVTFLAHTAAYNTLINYWGVVAKTVGVSDASTFFSANHHWGKIFLKIVHDFGLRDFSQAVVGNIYVSAIRLHGGIPAYSLPDFFEFILLPSVRKPEYAELPTPNLIETLLRRSTIQISVDHPVLNFLSFGGSASIEFVDRCRRMAQAYIKKQHLPTPEESDLPPYVVLAYQQYMEEEQPVSHGLRLRTPYLTLDPWGPEFYLYLPAEPIEDNHKDCYYFWGIEYYSGKEKISYRIEKVRLRQVDQELKTSDTWIPTDNVCTHIKVAFSRQAVARKAMESEVLHSWSLSLLPLSGQSPLMAFRWKTGKKVSWNQTLPSDELWLVYPRRVKLKVDGVSHLIESGVDFYGLWEGWQAQAWDLQKADTLRLFDDERELCAPISVRGKPPEPVLIGENQITQNIDPDDIPLFIGEPPCLKIPIRSNRSLEQELKQWHVKLDPRGTSIPKNIHEKGSLERFRPHIQVKNDALELPLAVLLGKRPIGTFLLTVSGPSDIHSEIRFRVWPELQIQGLQSYYLPAQSGALPVHFTIMLPAGSKIYPQASTAGVNVSFKGDQYTVTIAPEGTLAELILEAPGKGASVVHVPLTLAIPRLRWSLLHGQAESAITWNTSLISHPVAMLLQSEHATLYVELPIIEQLCLRFLLNLVDPGSGKILQSIDRPVEAHPGQKRWRFPLTAFFDTLRNLQDLPDFEFQLDVSDQNIPKSQVIPLMRLTRDLEISNPKLEHLSDTTCRLTWEEPYPLRNRRVCFWPFWRPWIDPIEISIPDEALGELEIRNASLPPSRYRIHFHTAPEWDKTPPPRDPPKKSFILQEITPSERLIRICELLEKYPESSFTLRWERACVYEACIMLSDRNAELIWLSENISEAPLELILVFDNWLNDHDKQAQDSLHSNMYSPDLLTKFFQNYPLGNDIRNAYLKYVPSVYEMNSESALLLITNEKDPKLIKLSLGTLIKNGYQEGIQKTIEEIRQGRLSKADATKLLLLNPELSLQSLEAFPEILIQDRQMEVLIQRGDKQNRYILKGFWVKTPIGWGQIERIEDLNGKVLLFFLKETTQQRLTLRMSDSNGPRAILDIISRTLKFQETAKLYICLRCTQFVSTIMRSLTDHTDKHHRGLLPKYGIQPTFIDINLPLEYLRVPPEDRFKVDKLFTLSSTQTTEIPLKTNLYGDKPYKSRKYDLLGHKRNVVKIPSIKSGITKEKNQDQGKEVEIRPNAATILPGPNVLKLGDPYPIKPGFWIHTDAGWGLIKKIVDIYTGDSLKTHFLNSNIKFLIHIALHTQSSFEESIILNLNRNTIWFPYSNEVYICLRCRKFMVGSLILTKSLVDMHSKAANHRSLMSDFVKIMSDRHQIGITKSEIKFYNPILSPDPLG